MTSNNPTAVSTDSFSKGKKSTEPKKCPGCNNPWRIIDQKCLQCMKRYHWYRYSTQQGLREQYEEEYMKENNRVGTE